MCICSSRCVYGMAHCKVKSSDDIIINVLETDGRSLSFGLCFHSIGNQSLHKLLRSHKTTSRHASTACPSFPYDSHYHMRCAWGGILDQNGISWNHKSGSTASMYSFVFQPVF